MNSCRRHRLISRVHPLMPSEANSTERTVQRLRVEEIEPAPRTARPSMTVVPSPERPDPAPEPVAAPPAPVAPVRVDNSHDAIHAAYAVASRILAPRAVLAPALVGAFVLAVISMLRADWPAFATLAAYCVLTIIPIVVLELRKNR